jgi:hypothetical protein
MGREGQVVAVVVVAASAWWNPLGWLKHESVAPGTALEAKGAPGSPENPIQVPPAPWTPTAGRVYDPIEIAPAAWTPPATYDDAVIHRRRLVE